MHDVCVREQRIKPAVLISCQDLVPAAIPDVKMNFLSEEPSRPDKLLRIVPLNGFCTTWLLKERSASRRNTKASCKYEEGKFTIHNHLSFSRELKPHLFEAKLMHLTIYTKFSQVLILHYESINIIVRKPA